MNTIKGLIGILAFSLCLWLVLVLTYTADAKNGVMTSPDGLPLPQASASCTSSGSSGGAE